MASPELMGPLRSVPETATACTGPICGVYYIDDGRIVHRFRDPSFPAFTFDDPALPPWGRVEHLGYSEIRATPDAPAPLLVAADLHPDEEEAARIAHRLLSATGIPRLEAMTMHTLAAWMGQREYIVQVDGRYASLPEAERILIPDNHQGLSDGRSPAKGQKIDLNRQFRLPDSVGSHDEATDALTYPAARMAIRLLQDHPALRVIVSHHEDWDCSDGSSPDGFYLYDSPQDARSDTDHDRVLSLFSRLRTRLSARGFGLYSGIDDPSDPDLGNEISDGYVYQPNVDRSGVRRNIVTFEGAAIELGRLGIGHIRRAFTLEIPMRMSPERKYELTALVYNEFLLPYLGMNRRVPVNAG